MGVFMATLFSAAVVMARLAFGPGPFEQIGVPWTSIVVAYYGALSIGGAAYGALAPLKRHALGAMLSGFVLVFPTYLSLIVLIDLTTKRIMSVNTALLSAVLVASFVGFPLGLSDWIKANKETRDGGAAP
jgi:hypothetical protein